MEDNLLLPFIMRESGTPLNDTTKIHCTDPTSKDHCITFDEIELKIPLHINSKFSFSHTNRPTADEIQSCEKIFINSDCKHWSLYCILYKINETSILNYKG